MVSVKGVPQTPHLGLGFTPHLTSFFTWCTGFEWMTFVKFKHTEFHHKTKQLSALYKVIYQCILPVSIHNTRLPLRGLSFLSLGTLALFSNLPEIHQDKIYKKNRLHKHLSSIQIWKQSLKHWRPNFQM